MTVFGVMGEEIFERAAQLQHENYKLLDELNHLKEHTFFIEETLNLKCSELCEEKKRLRSLEQQNSHLCQIIKEKEHLIDTIEHDKRELAQLNSELTSKKLSLKEELAKEKTKNKKFETLKTQEEDLRIAYTKIKQENQRLISELSIKSEECVSNAAMIKELSVRIKELENEKLELFTIRDSLRLRENEERLKSSENLEYFLKQGGVGWPKPSGEPHDQDEHNPPLASTREKISLNLCEEILEVELQEKQHTIVQLENLLREKEEEESKKNKLIADLKRELSDAGLLNYDSKLDLTLDSSAFYNIYKHLLKLVNGPEGHSGECKTLTEVATLSVVVKDGVQATQPSSVRLVETISIASQTDPIKNLSPVLPFKSFEKLQSKFNQNRSDSDDEEEPLSFLEENKVQFFSETKNCSLDMDLYRSCRKLSVLPEEDTDEFFNRKSSLKKANNSKYYNISPKTLSADDITKIKTVTPLLKETSSCLNFIPGDVKETDSLETLWKKNSVNENADEFRISFSSPKTTLRQPHSFDSYLNSIKTSSYPLARQISDPTQNTVFASSLARRGTSVKRPKSTCRPLTLPCKTDRKKEERVCKVRFDLDGSTSKRTESLGENELCSVPDSNASKKIKMVSRFTVEIVDEVEFRKSLTEAENRKRPPLIHSVVYKKSILSDVTNFGDTKEEMLVDVPKLSNFSSESADDSTQDVPVESLPSEGSDIESTGSNGTISDLHPSKRRRQSDVSCSSFEDVQDGSEESDILIKSVKLHTNSGCIVMKELKKEYSDSSGSNPDSEIPYIDAEDLPVIKPTPEGIKISPVADCLLLEKPISNVTVLSSGSLSDSSDAYLTPCDVTPVPENNESCSLGAPKSSGLSKSPTVLKNLANFELLASLSESKKLVIKEEEENTDEGEDGKCRVESNSLKRTASDMSDASESDTLTYGTVKSHVAGSSDCDSDTYVTVWSDRSFGFERKFSDLSENSSSPYNTPPDTSSASFCTPPDNYSPILSSLKKYSSSHLDRLNGSLDNNADKRLEELSDSVFMKYETPSFSPQFQSKFSSDNNELLARLDTETSKNCSKCNIIFDSPKLEFYETNDSVENLEAFLQTEEGLTEFELKQKPTNLENLSDLKFFEGEEFNEASSKRNSLDSPKPFERRSKKHPVLSRQNSTEEYIFLDPHDSCLNLSEEMSSPSTTPDTSNKTVIFKSIPLTVSNTIDLDDDFPISETEIQIHFDGSQPEIIEVKEDQRFAKGVQCLSEPCTPSISSADFLEFSVPRKQRSSFTDESLMCGKFEANLPEIIVSNLSSESENSESEVLGCAELDYTSNVSERSEVHLSDVNSVSGRSHNSSSFSEPSDNVSDVFSSNSEKSSAVSPEVSQNSSSSDNSARDLAHDDFPSNQAALCEDFRRSPGINPDAGVSIINVNHDESGEVSYGENTP